MRIDVHTHALHPKIAVKVVAQLEDHYSIKPVGDGTVHDLLARMRAARLDRVVVHSAATAPSQVIPANNWSIEMQTQHPEVLAFGTVHPDFEDNQAELDRLEAAGIRGIKIHPDFQGFRLDDKPLLPLLDSLRGRFVVMCHVGDRLPPEQNPSCPLKLARLVRELPGLTIIAAHLGGYLHWRESLAHLAGSPVYIDTSSSLSFIDQPLLEAIFERHPRERILFGSDYPLFDPGRELELLQSRLSLSDLALEEIVTNASRLLAES